MASVVATVLQGVAQRPVERHQGRGRDNVAQKAEDRVVGDRRHAKLAPRDSHLAVGALAGLTESRRSAVPVRAEDGRVVAKLSAARFDHAPGQALHGFARVQLPAGGQDRHGVDGCGVAFEHPVGEKDEPVARP